MWIRETDHWGLQRWGPKLDSGPALSRALLSGRRTRSPSVRALLSMQTQRQPGENPSQGLSLGRWLRMGGRGALALQHRGTVNRGGEWSPSLPGDESQAAVHASERRTSVQHLPAVSGGSVVSLILVN